jgi:hypothetical protein
MKMTFDYEEAVRKGKAIVAEWSGKQWAIGDLADTVTQNWGEVKLEEFAKDISFHGAPCTLGRCRDVCRAFPKNRVRPRFFASAQILATHPDRLAIVERNPAISKAEARELMRELRGEQNENNNDSNDDDNNEKNDNGDNGGEGGDQKNDNGQKNDNNGNGKGGNENNNGSGSGPKPDPKPKPKPKGSVDEREAAINENKRLLRLHLKLANEMIGAAEARKNPLSAEQREYLGTAALMVAETLETMEKAGDDWLEYVAWLKELKAEKEAWLEARHGHWPVRASAPAEPAQAAV